MGNDNLKLDDDYNGPSDQELMDIEEHLHNYDDYDD